MHHKDSSMSALVRGKVILNRSLESIKVIKILIDIKGKELTHKISRKNHSG